MSEYILSCPSFPVPFVSDRSSSGTDLYTDMPKAERDAATEHQFPMQKKQEWGQVWSSEGDGGCAAQGMRFGSVCSIRLEYEETAKIILRFPWQYSRLFYTQRRSDRCRHPPAIFAPFSYESIISTCHSCGGI